MTGKKNVVGKGPPAGGDAGAAEAVPSGAVQTSAPSPEPAGEPAEGNAAGAKAAGRKSLAAQLMTRALAGKTPTASRATGQRSADAARSSGKPVTGGRGNNIPRRGASKGR